MKLRSTAIALGVGAATAAGLSLLKVDKPVVIGSTAVVIGAGLILLKEENEKEDLNGDNYYDLIDYKSESEKYEGEISDFQNSIESSPTYKDDSWRPYFNTKSQDHKCAIRYFNKAISNDLNNANLYSQRARAKANMNEKEEAMQDFSKAIELDPSNGIFYFQRGLFRQYSNEFQGASEDYSKAIELNPKNSKPYIWRALLWQKFKYYAHSIEDYNKAIELDPKNGDYYFLRGEFKRDWSTGLNFPRAELVEQAKKDGSDLNAFEEKYSFNYRSAIADYCKAIEIDPNNAEYLFSLGDICWKKDYLLGACEQWKKAADSNNGSDSMDNYTAKYSADLLKTHCPYKIELDKDSSFDIDLMDYYLEGRKKELDRDFEGAIYCYTKCLEKRPTNTVLLNSRGHAKSLFKDREGALKDFDKALEIDPNDQQILQNRALNKRKSGNYKGAILDYTRLVEMSPDCCSTRYLRGRTYHDSGDYELAIQDFTKTIELNPGQTDGYHLRGLSYLELNSYEFAIKDFTKAIELDFERSKYSDPWIYFSRAIAQVKLEDYTSALSDFSKSIELDTDLEGFFSEEYHQLYPKNTYLYRANCKQQLGDLKGACKDWQKASEYEIEQEEAIEALKKYCQ